MIRLEIISNIGEIISFIKKQHVLIDKKIKSNLVKVGKFLKRESKLNAPYKTGQLRKDIKYEVKDDTVIIYVQGKSSPYASIMHYNKYKRGSGTIRQGGRAGRLYIQRALNDNENKVAAIFGDIL